MRWNDPKPWLAATSLALVGFLAWRDTERISPGPLTAPHAAEPDLAGRGGCVTCHGDSPQDMHAACDDCHTAIGAQLLEEAGFHGALAPDLVRDCGACHVEHHGDEARLVSDLSFTRAGVADRAEFDHGHVAFELGGRHDELGCAECHANADAELLPAGEPRFLGARQDCASCHEDPHEGRFSRGCATCHGQEQPFAELASFVHGEAFPLTGAHGEPSCLACHAKGSGHEVEDLAGHTPPPPPRDCAACHESPHAEAFVSGVASLASGAPGASCALCHDALQMGFRPEATLTAEQHAATGFPLDEPHAEVTCDECHAAAEPGGSESEVFARRFPGRDADTCQACHADPHEGQFEVGPFARTGCLTCHGRRRFDPPRFDASLHARTAFPLEGAHVDVSCAECHAPPADGGGTRFAAAPSDCAACHADPHAGSLTPLPGEAGCAACHTTTRFDDVDRKAFAHAERTSFELRGAHARAQCETCHQDAPTPGLSGRTFGRVADVFPGPADRCATCHEGVHRGAFADVRDGCARCHDQGSFRPHRFARFPHDEFTGFPLDGAHDAVRCEACHGPSALATRSFGFVAERYPGPAERCETCHTDVHAGQFDQPGLPALLAGRAGCARCHTTESFSLHTDDPFDHGLWTGYALEGAHARVDCARCHPRDRTASAGRRLGEARGQRCADCHADPHAGQFRQAGTTDCAACHTQVDGFLVPDFDHARGTRFALDETHAQLECAACHRPWPLPDGREVVRYKPLGVLCGDCHAPGTGPGRRDGR